MSIGLPDDSAARSLQSSARMDEPSEQDLRVRPTRGSIALALLITAIWARLHEGDIVILLALGGVALVLFVLDLRARRAVGGPR